jgi:hypothetical protein
MTTIVTRTTVGSNTGKGSPLTHTEVDTNFVNLNTAKLETGAIPLGTLQAPSVSFLNDSDTGIFCPQGGNSLAIATGGQYAITCTSTQAVGIQTANPNAALHVAGNARVGADDVTDAVLEIGAGASGNRTSYIDIVADTTYTDYGLRIIRNNTGANATSELKHRGTGALNFTTQEAAPIVFNTTNSPALTILAGGSVGIGSSNPQALLHISSATTATERISGTAGNSDNTECANIDFQNNTSGSVVGRIRSLTGVGGIQSGKGQLAFFAHNGTSLLERVRINEDGLVGIGVTSPKSILTTQGNIVGLSETTHSLQHYQQAAASYTVTSIDSVISGASGLLVFKTAANWTNGDAVEAARIRSDGMFEVKGAGTAGSSPAFSVNGSAPANSAIIDSSGRLLVGTSTARSSINILNQTDLTPSVQFEGQSTSNRSTGLSIINYSASDFGPAFTLGASNSNILGTNTLVESDGDVGVINFVGADGTRFVSCASIAAEVDGTPGVNDMPGRLVFSTTADEAATPTERMRITSYGTFLASNAGSYPTTTGTYHAFSANSPDDLILRLNNTSSTNPYGVNVVFDAAAPNDTTRFFLNCADNAALRATIRSNGGLANYSANNANLSDRNVKKDISPAANTWNCIKEWEIVNYRYKDQPDDADLNLGVIAQQVAESCPEVITIFQEAKEATEDKPAQEERLGVKEQQMYWMAIKALQEAMGRIEQLETKVAALESA